VRQPNVDAAAAWLASFCADFENSAVGETVPVVLHPPLPLGAPDTAPLGVSMARGAVAETGSLIMDARDGRRAQLLVPTHVVFVHTRDIYATLREALIDLVDDLPSAIAFHSGPSKSADIGQIVVKGVHGPGRLVAVLIDGGT
jgi:L-lactate dehydrogenase complex protein LldG